MIKGCIDSEIASMEDIDAITRMKKEFRNLGICPNCETTVCQVWQQGSEPNTTPSGVQRCPVCSKEHWALENRCKKCSADCISELVEKIGATGMLLLQM